MMLRLEVQELSLDNQPAILDQLKRVAESIQKENIKVKVTLTTNTGTQVSSKVYPPKGTERNNGSN